MRILRCRERRNSIYKLTYVRDPRVFSFLSFTDQTGREDSVTVLSLRSISLWAQTDKNAKKREEREREKKECFFFFGISCCIFSSLLLLSLYTSYKRKEMKKNENGVDNLSSSPYYPAPSSLPPSPSFSYPPYHTIHHVRK